LDLFHITITPIESKEGNILIYIVTPVFNRKDFTQNYLRALGKQTEKNFKTIIIDDGSTDGTPEMVTQEFPEVILLKEKGDLWWAEATNIGVRYALEHDATHIITLNDDTIPETDFMEKMIYWSQRVPEALLGAAQVDHDTNKIVYGGEQRSWATGKSTYLLHTLPKSEHAGIHEVSQFPGRGLMVPKKVFEQIGLYDSKNFPQTIADLDFTHRAVNNGFKIYCNFDAKIRMFPEETAMHGIRTNKSLKNYFRHLTNIKGGGNLKFFVKCALKNCPKKYLPIFLTKGVLSRMASYWIK